MSERGTGSASGSAVGRRGQGPAGTPWEHRAPPPASDRWPQEVTAVTCVRFQTLPTARSSPLLGRKWRSLVYILLVFEKIV